MFQTKRALLQSLEEFSRAWILLLEHVENSALSKNSEVRSKIRLLVIFDITYYFVSLYNQRIMRNILMMALKDLCLR